MYSNDSLNSQTEVTIRADVGNPNHALQTAPEQADFGQVLIGNNNEKTIILKNNSVNWLKVKFVDMPSPKQIQDVRIGNSNLDPSASTEIEIKMTDFIMLGDFRTSLTIESERDPSTRTTIPILGTVVDNQ